MKRLIIFLFFAFVSMSVLAAGGIIQKYNPFTGRPDFLGPGNGLQPGDTYYLYNNGTNTAYWTFDSTNLCLYVNGTSKVCYAQSLANQFLLLEDGTFLLLEDGTEIILQ